MSLFNPFAAIGNLITSGIASSPFGRLAGIGQGGGLPGMPAPGVQTPARNMPQMPVVGGADPAVQTARMQPALDRGKMETPDLRRGIQESALALGIDPLDLATAISYETGGTFDPTKKGPTTKWGQHRGFIQFGEPQAREFGVDWNNPVASQLGADGAVVKYLRKAGVKPGMGLLDVYSAINAGAPGLYDRSDAAAGGAPGTVADKVRGMAGHRQKAEALFGGQFTPGPSTPMSPVERVLAAVQGQGGASAPQVAGGVDTGGAGSEAPTPLQRVMQAIASKPSSRQQAGAQQSSGGGQEQGPTSNMAEVAARKQQMAALAGSATAQPSTAAQARKQALRTRIGLGNS